MKKFLLYAVFVLVPFSAFAQTQHSTGPNSPNIANVHGDVNIPPTKKEEPAQTALTERQTDKITIAIKDYQIAQMSATQAQNAVGTAQQAVVAVVEKVKKELGLDDTWDFNYQTLTFFKKPTPEPAPSAKK